jgi:flavin-dependent dehydrogenase
VVAHTDSGDYSASILVGADGANSVVSRLLNKREDYFWQAAVYCEIPEDLINCSAVSADCMRIDWGSLPSGYAWVFPKRGYVNIGAGGPVAIARLLRPYVTRFIQSTNMLKSGVSAPLSLNGHQLPTLTRRTRFASKRILLVGDAAGLVEPFTGDGISFACQSARIAADCIYHAFRTSDPNVSAYNRQLKSDVAAEVLWSRKLLTLSTAFPDLVYRLFKHNDRIWQTFCRILRGEESFQRLKNEILGPLQLVSKAVDVVTQRREHSALGVQSLTSLLRQFSA